MTMKLRASEKEFEFRGARLSFGAFVKLFLLMGFLAGLVTSPLYVILQLMAGESPLAALTLFFGPVITGINAGILGLFAYPLYTFLANRYVSFRLHGYVATSYPNEP